MAVCDRCQGCYYYDEYNARIEAYIEIFFDADICIACGGTGITEVDFKCPLCGTEAPWQFKT